LSEEALAQFHLFQDLLFNLEPSQNVDSWTILGKVDIVKVSSVYKSLMHSGGAIPASNGCGKDVVSKNIKCSSGSCYIID
jgi:hypothetical protein